MEKFTGITGKKLLESSSTYLQHAEEAELRGKEQMQLHGKFFCCWEVFTCVVRVDSLRKGTELLLGENLVIQDPQTQVEQGNTSLFILHFDIHLHTSTHQWYQINTPLLTQMKSSNTSQTSPTGREKCSTPYCKRVQVRCSHLLIYRSLAFCAPSLFHCGHFPTEKGKKMWKLTLNDNSKSVHKTKHAKSSLLPSKSDDRPWHWWQKHCKSLSCYFLPLKSFNMSLKTLSWISSAQQWHV